MTEVRLYGPLRAKFGRSFNLEVSSPAEAVRALCIVVPGFQRFLLEHSQPGYRVVIGKTPIMDDHELRHPVGRQRIGIVPVVAGAAGGGKVLFGAALIGLSFLLPGGALVEGFAFSASSIAFNLGVSMVLGGVSQMLASSPKATAPSERAENKPSFAFNGPVNTTGQGNAIPVLLGGPLRIGSQVISTGLSVAQLAV